MPDLGRWIPLDLSLGDLAGPLDAAGPNPALLLLMAFLLDALLGGLLWRLPVHPYRLQSAAARFCAVRLNRAERSERTRLVRGVIALLAILGLSAAAGFAAHALLAAHAYGWSGELGLLTLSVAARRPFVQALRVARALKRGGLQDARAALEMSGQGVRSAARADSFGMARLAIEDCAASFANGVVGPAFWFLLLGLPGLFAYRGLMAFDATLGPASREAAAFGLLGRRLAEALDFVPSRIAGLIVALAAVFAPTALPHRSFATALGSARWSEAAFAGALGLALMGPAQGGVWLGRGRARATALDVGRALLLYGAACLVFAGVVAALAAAGR